jgi:hypothetical protein
VTEFSENFYFGLFLLDSRLLPPAQLLNECISTICPCSIPTQPAVMRL